MNEIPHVTLCKVTGVTQQAVVLIDGLMAVHLNTQWNSSNRFALAVLPHIPKGKECALKMTELYLHRKGMIR